MENRKKHNYKNLKIWQIANDVFEILSQFHSEKKYDLSSQMKRCAISIPNNLVEVTSKTNKSFSHFIDISLGSSCELVTQLIIANNRNYLSNEKLEKNENKLDEFQRMTTGFQKTL
jgi:four helix bundle protein